MSFCSNCGTKVIDGQRFCTACGLTLEIPTPGASAPAASVPAAGAASNKSSQSPSSTIFIARIAVGVVVGLGLIWVFFPGLLDSKSSSPLMTENRRSPLVEMIKEPQIYDKVVALKEDEFGGPSFALRTTAKVTVIVKPTSGPKIDVYLLTRDGYEQYRAAAGKLFGGEFRHFNEFEGIVGKGETYQRSATMQAGDYVVLLDNTDSGAVSPPANFANDRIEAAVQIKIE